MEENKEVEAEQPILSNIPNQNIEQDHHEKVYNLVMDDDEVSWQSIIYELINKGDINPWNVDVSLLTQKYIEEIKKLQELDFRLSGKVLLAAAFLLKIKSKRLMGEDLENLDRLFSQTEEEESLFEDDLLPQKREQEKYNLIPNTPQPRKRKVSIYDLVNALEQALDVKRRRVMASIPPTNLEIPEKRADISDMIKDIYQKIRSYFYSGAKGRLTFSQLIPDDTREGKVYTFIPLLHLTNQRKVDLEQYQHFGDIEIMLNKNKEEIDKELSAS